MATEVFPVQNRAWDFDAYLYKGKNIAVVAFDSGQEGQTGSGMLTGNLKLRGWIPLIPVFSRQVNCLCTKLFFGGTGNRESIS